MIEMIAVLVILSIVCAIAFMKMSSTARYSAKAQAEIIKSHIRHAQSQAINSNVIWGINFIDSTHYALFKNGNTGVTVTFAGAETNPIDLSSKGASLSNLGGGIIAFDSWGIPYTDAAAASIQAEARTLTVTVGSESETIQITPNTGYIP